jgi:PAS domain S-box-containing protein
MLTLTPEQAARLFPLTQSLVAADTAAALLRAFLAPLWQDHVCNAQMLYIENKGDRSANPVVDILASESPRPDISMNVVPLGRYYISEVSIPVELISGAETFYYVDLDTSGSFVPDLLVRRWRDQGWHSVVFFVLQDALDANIAVIVDRCAVQRTDIEQQRELYAHLIPIMASLAHNQRRLITRERTLELTEALYEANRKLLLAADYDETLDVVFDYASASGAKVASLLSVELTESGRPAWGAVIARAGLEQGLGSPLGSRFYLPDIPFSRLWLDLDDDILIIEDTQTDSRVDVATREAWHRVDVGASVLMPLRRHGTWIGLLTANWDRRHLFTSFEKEFYRALSTQVATVLDNQRLRAAERLAMEKLAHEEAQYRLLADHSTDMITRTLPDTTLTYVSPSSISLLGYTPEELLGTVSVQLLHPDDLPRDRPSREEQRSDHLQTQFRLRQKDGSYLWAEATVRYIYNEDGTLRERLSVTRDISKRKEAEDRANTLNAQLMAQAAKLQAANSELEAFTYSVSHDLRAPLRAMDGFSKMLGEKYREQIPDEARRYLDRIRVNAVQMGALIDDLLSLSRVSKRALETHECAMEPIARMAFQEAASGQDVQAVNFIVGDLPSCEGDSGLLKQVFVNLLANAVKFTRNRPNPTIEVGVNGQEQGSPVYFVRDNGVGFDMQYADKIFGVFQRLHDSRQYEGTGVGLAIVYRIISRHNGRIWVNSAPGEGTTFYFTVGGRHGGTDS